MVKKWSDVASSPDFAALSDDDKDTVRSAYFERVVAPNVAPDQLDATRAQFETAAGYRRRSLPPGVQPSTVQGGRGAQGGPTAAELAQANTSKAPGLWETNSTVAQDPLAPADTSEPPAPGSSVLDQPYTGSDLGLSTAPVGPRVKQPVQSQDRMQETPIEQRLGQDIRTATGSSGFGAAVQGTASGIAGLGKVVPGLVAAGADLVGADDTRDFALGAAQKADNFSKSVEPHGVYYNKLIGNVFASTVQSLPTVAFGLEGGGAEIAGGKAVADAAAKRAMSNSMRELFVQTAGQEYADARNNGSSPIDSAARASIFGAAEVLGERFGFHEQMALLRAAVGKKTIPSHQLAQVLATEMFKEIPGEELTTALEFLADKYGPAGMSPKATLADYLEQAADTAIQTVGQTALMGAPAMIRHGVGEARRRADAAIAYDQAAINGFHVEPPLATDPPDKQRAKTIAIFQAMAAQSGIDPDAEARAVDTAKTMPAADVGPFLNRLAQAFQKRGLAAKPIEEHASDALVAGPIEDPKLVEQQRKEAEKAAEGEKKAPAAAEGVETPAAAEDLSGLSEPSESVHPIQDSDLTTGDGQPYGTRGSAAARATREGAGEVVRVPGGWVVRAEAAQNAADESAQPDLRTAPAEPASSPAGRSGEPGGSEPTLGRVAFDTTPGGKNAAGEPVASSGAAEPVRASAEAPGAVGPRVIAQIGTMPNSARPLELRQNKDGTLTPWHAGHEVVDFESGDPVKIPGDATDAQALDAVKKSGAFGRRTKYFQTHATTAAESSSTALNTGTGETPGPGKAEAPQSTQKIDTSERPVQETPKSEHVEGATHAAQEINQPAGVQGKHQDGNQGGQAPEAGSGDRVQRAGASEEGKPAAAPQEVAPKAGETDQPATAAEAHEALQRGETLVHHRGTEHESRTWLAETKVGEKGQTWVIKSKSADSPVTITKGPAGPDRSWGWGKTDAAAKAVEGMHFDENARGPQDKRGLRAEDRALAELHSNSEDLAAQMANDVREDDFDAAEVLPALIAWAKKANLPVETLRTDVLRQLGTMEIKKSELKKLTAALDVKSEPKAKPTPAPRTLADHEAFAQDYAAFTGRTVTRAVPIAGTTRTASLKSDARKTMQALDTRLKALEELKTCIGAHS